MLYSLITLTWSPGHTDKVSLLWLLWLTLTKRKSPGSTYPISCLSITNTAWPSTVCQNLHHEYWLHSYTALQIKVVILITRRRTWSSWRVSIYIQTNIFITNICLANLHSLENTQHGRGPVHPVPGVQLNIMAASILYQQERPECTNHKLVNKINMNK